MWSVPILDRPAGDADVKPYPVPAVRALAPRFAGPAKTLGMSTVRLNGLVRRKRGITANTALRLAQLFKTTPQFWMHMPANFDLKAAMVRGRVVMVAKRA